MPENVQTGGIMNFRYEKAGKQRISESERREIEEAYARADERKRRERRDKKVKWIVIALIIILIISGISYYFLR